MDSVVEGLIAQLGTRLTLSRGEESQAIKALLQPVRSTSWQSMEDTATPLGQISQRQYRFIAAPDPQVMEGDILGLGEKRYCLRRVETVYLKDTPLYQWGLCVERGEAETWGA